MSTRVSYVNTGRKKQKSRTRAALIDAARALLASGFTPTVEQAADQASVSRATAYRYFPSRHALLVAAHPEVEVTSLLGPDPPDDATIRIDIVTTGLAKFYLGAEASYRAMLRLSLDPDPSARGELALRQGLRYPWIREALEPVRASLRPEQFDRLVNAIAAAIGIEAIVAHLDLGGLTPDQAIEVMRWTAKSLVEQALRDANAS